MSKRSHNEASADEGVDDLAVDALMTPQQLAAIDAELAETESSSLSQRLTEYFNPPPDLNERAVGRIKGSMVNRETMMLAADLFSVGWRTTRIVVAPPPQTKDQD